MGETHKQNRPNTAGSTLTNQKTRHRTGPLVARRLTKLSKTLKLLLQLAHLCLEYFLLMFLEISNGDVFLSWNNEMCFENTIMWEDIVTGEGATVHNSNLKNPNYTVRKCKTPILCSVLDLRKICRFWLNMAGSFSLCCSLFQLTFNSKTRNFTHINLPTLFALVDFFLTFKIDNSLRILF